jgi:hypothetical protein
MSVVATVDALEEQINIFLSTAEMTGTADVSAVMFQCSKVQMEMTDLSQRVKQKSLLLEEESRCS